MPKSQVFEDKKVNQEFDTLQQTIPKLIVSTVTPAKGGSGLMWWNPSTSKFKIWGVKDWVSIN